MVVEGNLTSGAEHNTIYIYDVLVNHACETYMILLTNITPIHLIRKERE